MNTNIQVSDGFKLFREMGSTCGIVESKRIEACMEYFLDQGCDGICINASLGYLLPNVDFLENYPQVRRVEIISDVDDLKGLYALNRLEYLQLSCIAALDLAQFVGLKKLFCLWSRKLRNLGKSTELEVLHLHKFRPVTQNLELLSELHKLREVAIISSTIDSLSGLGKMAELKFIELSYIRKLVLIDIIEENADSLISFLCEKCPNIHNHDYARRLSKLEVLGYNHCGRVPSIAFIRDLPKLRSFRFVGTNVLDGDMTPCIGLKYAGFTKKRHYSHSPKEIAQLSQGT